MNARTFSAVLATLALLCASVVFADGELLKRLDKRDKFYDLVQWDKDVWLVGHPGHILSSSDQGQTWTEHAFSERAAIFSMDWFDSQTAVLCGMDGLFMHTDNRGKSWEPIKLAPTEERFQEKLRNPLFDVEALHGTGQAWVVGHFLTILHTNDKGATWEFQEYTLPEDQWDEPGLNSVDFIDDQHGWIVGEFATILRTVDGGKTWIKLPYPEKWASRSDLEVKDYPPLFHVSFQDENSGIILGSEGSLFITHDGGQTLIEQKTGFDKHLFFATTVKDMVYAVAQDGYIVSGKLDGSGPFVAKRAGVYVWLNSILFVNDQIGLAAGGRGTLLRTTDGGVNWTQLSGR
jgi:photosystem II stability/assembly factor-like uncharacterized protein